MTTSFIHPALIMILGAFLLPFLREPFKKIYIVFIPLLTFIDVLYLNMHHGTYGVVEFLRWDLTFGRVDSYSAVFGFIMALMAIIGSIYGLHVKNVWHHVAAWFYVAGSLGVIYCGDYLVLFLFWEMMAFASTFLIWLNKEKGALAAGYRYLLVHTFGGVLLLLGFVLMYQETKDLSFVLLDESNTQLYTWLIMAGLMLNAAVPPLHSWLPDAYSKATAAGAVFMCAFTTKTAVYTLIRAFAGFDVLIILGVVMAIYGIVYAIMENDIRRLLGWEIVSQVGYMVAGVGIGTALAINGACAHAFAHILYKGLLFMGAGAIIHATGKSKFTDLGGLYAKMPKTLLFMVIGGISVSAFPFFSGFVTKSMIIAASFKEHMLLVAFLLTMVSAGTFLVAGLRLPYLLFFSERCCSEETYAKAQDPPWNMQAAMIIAAFFCLLIGTYLPFLYDMLPDQAVLADFHPFDQYHLSETLQILGFTAFAFYFLRKKIGAEATISLDLDWFYRRGGQAFLWLAKHPIQWADNVWGAAYRVVGLDTLMTTARFWSWFDWHGIDGVVDGSARLVRGMGRRVATILQRGQIQMTIYYTVTFAAILLITFVLL